MKTLNITIIAIIFFANVAKANNDFGSANENVATTSIIEETAKNSGTISYRCGNVPCDGYKETYHSNGTIEVAGTFKNGIVVDTLKKFHTNGQLLSIKYPNIETGFEKDFYLNGEVKRFANNSTKACTYYYEGGQVKLSYTYEDGQRTNITQYYANGQARLAQKGNTQTAYYPNGNVAYKMERSEIYKANRIFNGNDFRFYDYEFVAYNEFGVIVTTAAFSGSDVDYRNGFPLSIKEVKITDFEEVIYNDNAGNGVRKETFDASSTTRTKKTTFVMQNGTWNKVDTESLKFN